jgi:hypothetical protein
MKNAILLLAALAICIAGMFFLVSCKDKSNPTNPNTITEDVPLTEAQSNFLETVKDTSFRLEDIILENGQDVRTFLQENDPTFLNKYSFLGGNNLTTLSPSLQKCLFLARMYTMGFYLVDDSKHTHPSAGSNQPAQTGLAYSWGSKDYDKRQIPPGVTGQCKDLSIYGLDCSGMIWAMTQAANLPPVVPKYNFFVEEITDAPKWTEAFRTSADYKYLQMKNMQQLPQGSLEDGDIILWGSHVGIYLCGSLLQSNGTPHSPGCNNNLSPTHGPRLLSFAEALTTGKGGWNLGDYNVFRIFPIGVSGRISLTASISGTRTYSPNSGYKQTKTEEGSANLEYNLSKVEFEGGVDRTANWNDAGFKGTANWVSVHEKTYTYICDAVKDRWVTDKETTTQTFSSASPGLQITGAGLTIGADDSYIIQLGPSTSLTAATTTSKKEYSGYCNNPPPETYTNQTPIPFAYYFIQGFGGFGGGKLMGKMDPAQPDRINGVYHGIDSITMFSINTDILIRMPLKYTLTWDFTITK